MLNRFRRRRLRTHLSLLAIVALLWSQMALAWHADCFAVPMPYEMAAVSAVHEHCAGQGDVSERVVCDAHCNQGNSSPETPRAALSVPALPPDPPFDVAFALQVEKGDFESTAARVGAAWHRPTSHPASVLLI